MHNTYIECAKINADQFYKHWLADSQLTSEQMKFYAAQPNVGANLIVMRHWSSPLSCALLQSKSSLCNID